MTARLSPYGFAAGHVLKVAHNFDEPALARVTALREGTLMLGLPPSGAWMDFPTEPTDMRKGSWPVRRGRSTLKDNPYEVGLRWPGGEGRSPLQAVSEASSPLHLVICFAYSASMWMVRAGRGGENADEFLERGVVGFGGRELGPLSLPLDKKRLEALYAEKFPGAKAGSRQAWTHQLMRCVGEIKRGDEVISYDAERRRYLFGTVEGEYEYSEPSAGPTPHVRRVKWIGHVPRDVLSVETRNTLGSIMTVFKVNASAAAEVRQHVQPVGQRVEPPPEVRASEAKKSQEQLVEIAAETFDKAGEFIEDQINALDWEQMQELVAGILRAMGYRTSVSPRGPDRGVDVFASRDGLGLEEPRIFVEVKHRAAAMGAVDVRAFLGGRKAGDKCLYVSTGGFRKDAHYEAERSHVALTLVTLPRLRQLLVDFYESLDAETRALVPLRRLYWPVAKG